MHCGGLLMQCLKGARAMAEDLQNHVLSFRICFACCCFDFATKDKMMGTYIPYEEGAEATKQVLGEKAE